MTALTRFAAALIAFALSGAAALTEAQAVVLTFGSPTNPESSISYDGGVLDGAFAIGDLKSTGRTGGEIDAICERCVFDFSATGGTRSGDIWSFDSGSLAVTGDRLGGIETGGEALYQAQIDALQVVSLGDGLFSVVLGAHSGGNFLDSYLASVGLVGDAGTLTGHFEASFNGAIEGDGFTLAQGVTGGELLVRGLSDPSEIPEPAPLLLAALAGLGIALRRRRSNEPA